MGSKIIFIIMNGLYVYMYICIYYLMKVDNLILAKMILLVKTKRTILPKFIIGTSHW